MNKEFRSFYEKGIDWLLIAGPKILLGVVMLFLGLWIIRFLRNRFRKAVSKKNVNSSLRLFIENLLFTALYVLLFFFILQIIGVQLTVFAAVIAAFGAAAGLALSGTLQNFASGVIILFLKPFKVGDNIIAQNIEGKVESIQIFYTIVKAFDNRSVIMPNSKLSNEVIVNITRDGVRRLDITLELDMKVSVDSIRNILVKAFEQSKDVLDTPKVRIGITEFTSGNYKLMINLWINAHGFEDTRRVVNEYIIKVLKEHNILSKDEDISEVK
jgi:small conductance mechanosensitive channel